jgi:hypothetical protein
LWWLLVLWWWMVRWSLILDHRVSSPPPPPTPPQLTTIGNNATNKHYLHTQIIKLSLYSTDRPTFISAGGPVLKTLYNPVPLCKSTWSWNYGLKVFIGLSKKK